MNELLATHRYTDTARPTDNVTSIWWDDINDEYKYQPWRLKRWRRLRGIQNGTQKGLNQVDETKVAKHHAYKEFGAYIHPLELTPGQKECAKALFMAVRARNLGWTHQKVAIACAAIEMEYDGRYWEDDPLFQKLLNGTNDLGEEIIEAKNQVSARRGVELAMEKVRSELELIRKEDRYSINAGLNSERAYAADAGQLEEEVATMSENMVIEAKRKDELKRQAPRVIDYENMGDDSVDWTKEVRLNNNVQ